MVQHGIVLIINGPIVPSLMESFGIGERSIGFLLSMGSFGFLMGPLIAGTIIDRIGLKAAFITGLLIEVAFFLVFGLSRTFYAVVIANVMVRLGASFLETGGNVMPTLIQSDSSAHSRMNLVHVFFSVGAFIGPVLIGLYIQRYSVWRPVLLFALVPTVVLFAWVIAAKLPNTGAKVAERHLLHDVALAVRNRATVFGAVSLMLYVGAEVGISSWVVLYLRRVIGLNTAQAASGLSVLWLAIMIGRYLNSLAGRKYSSRLLVNISGVGGLVGVLVFVLLSHPVSVFLIIGWIGLCLSGVFPNIMAELNNREPERAGTTTAVMAIGAALGAAVFQGVVGAVADAVSLKAAFVLLGFLQIIVVGTFYLALKPESGR